MFPATRIDVLMNLFLAIICFSKCFEIILKSNFPSTLKRAIGQKASIFEGIGQSILGM